MRLTMLAREILAFTICCFWLPTSCVKAEIPEEKFAAQLGSVSAIDDPTARLKGFETLLTGASDYERFVALPSAAKTAMMANDLTKAKRYANQLSDLVKLFPGDWNYGNAIHDSNVVLGVVSLHSGLREEAKSYLLKAGATPASPQLKTFGPNMMLAKALLERGEKAIVIQYLRLCKKFWQVDGGRLDSWIASIEGGGEPYFGTNLSY